MGSENMKKGSTVGLILLVAGIVIWVAYGLYLGFDEIMQAIDLVTGFIAGLIVVGLIVLIVSIFIEQRRDTKKMKEEIKKEDLEP
jgi:high-affinity Fe2+/Pb2+ permease